MKPTPTYILKWCQINLRKERKKGRKEGRKKGRKEGRKEKRKEEIEQRENNPMPLFMS